MPDVLRLTRDRFDDVVDVLCDSFRDYPVMRYILSDAGDAYEERLPELIAQFTIRRFLSGHPVLGLEDDDGRLVAAANIDPPRAGDPGPELAERAERLRRIVGDDAIARLGAFADACRSLEPDGPKYELGMLGVRHECQGRGHARPLLEALHAMSEADPDSRGVCLTTELPVNLTLYERFGYRTLGRAETADGGLETWTMFREDPTPG